jgi:exosortase A-associated hydrolase 1
MARDMRRLLTFTCQGATLGATLDDATGEIGLLLVTGGSQTRIGSHRMYERLAYALQENGIPCFRFDRRGVGDSEGEDPGYRASRPDLIAAGAAFRSERPALRRVFGFGLCDGATAIALFGAEAGLDGLILVNPWLVEAEADEPPAAAIRAHYRQQLLSLEGWKKLLFGAVSYRKILRGIARIFSRQDPSLPAAVASAMARHTLPAQLILAGGDATAIAAEAELAATRFKGLVGGAQKLETDSHTFARPGDETSLHAAVVAAIGRLDQAS